MDSKELGKRISELRKKNNMSQQDLADKLNVSNKTISKWECGNGLPDVIALNNMANIFGITLDELMNSNEPAEKTEEPAVQHPKAEKRKRPILWTVLIISVVVIIAVSSVLCFLFISRDPEILESNMFSIDATENTLSYTVDNNVDTGATNRKLGSDMADSVTGGGLHGKDLSKADVSVNIYAWLEAQRLGKPVELCCAIGDETVNGISYEEIVETARDFIRAVGGFEKFAEWGLV